MISQIVLNNSSNVSVVHNSENEMENVKTNWNKTLIVW